MCKLVAGLLINKCQLFLGRYNKYRCQTISEQCIDKRNGQIRDKISTENITTESAFGK